ncbi:hypothetical protein SISNIDRAFT_429761, partial [Sistotremastrum niveocremeum HHB9708]
MSTHQSMHEMLPIELWRRILSYAVADSPNDLLLLARQTSFSFMKDHEWIYSPLLNAGRGDWFIRTPEEASKLLQRSSYGVKKAIILVSRAWRIIATELLYTRIVLERPGHLAALLDRFQDHPELAWWTRSVSLYPYLPTTAPVSAAVSHLIVRLLELCPNIEHLCVAFYLDAHPSSSIIQKLCTTHLQHLKWIIPRQSSLNLIRSLTSLKSLRTLDLQITDSDLPIPIASPPSSCTMPNLGCISLSGELTEFVNELNTWHCPLLITFSIKLPVDVSTQKACLEFITRHARQLISLNINSVTPWNVADLLRDSPNLREFGFNPDWPISKLIHFPHDNLEDIGLHEMWYGFEVGQGEILTRLRPVIAGAVRIFEDRTITQITRENFPRVRRVRVLDGALLKALYLNGGPAQESVALCDGWMKLSEVEGWRLEDCTGTKLGLLP